MDTSLADESLSRKRRGLKEIMGERNSQMDVDATKEDDKNVYYTCQSGSYASGFQSEIMKGLYALAKKKHWDWIMAKQKENEIPKIK